jgi:hypothetical protein
MSADRRAPSACDRGYVIDWAAPPPVVSPCGPVMPQCHRCGKPGPNCPVRVTVDVRTGVRTLWYCGVD